MRGYTSLEQSKKLAEFLPLESADMSYLSEESLVPKIIYNGMAFFNSKEERPTNIIYCWSLAALLSIMPRRIELEGVAYELSIYLNGLYYWNVNNGNLLLEVKGKDNLVDACYEMILKLHEQNFL